MLRRILGGLILLALVAPVFLPALPGVGGIVKRPPSGGCCAAVDCCASGGPCATGGCESSVSPAVAAAGPHNDDTPRLAAECGGPARATTVADRDPMVSSPKAALPAPPHVTAPTPRLAMSASEPADDPIPHPPRA